MHDSKLQKQTKLDESTRIQLFVSFFLASSHSIHFRQIPDKEHKGLSIVPIFLAFCLFINLSNGLRPSATRYRRRVSGLAVHRLCSHRAWPLSFCSFFTLCEQTEAKQHVHIRQVLSLQQRPRWHGSPSVPVPLQASFHGHTLSFNKCQLTVGASVLFFCASPHCCACVHCKNILIQLGNAAVVLAPFDKAPLELH